MKVTGPAVLWERTSSDKAVRSFEDAYAVVSGQLSALAEENPIFEAHLEMLQDPMVTDTVQANMAAGMQPLKALDSAGNAIASMFAGIDDEYLAARVDDVRDIFRRLRDAMTGNSSPQAEFPEGGILVAEELLPSDTSKIDFSKVRGILCAKGSTTSHVCIIARSKGVPIRVGADISGIREGDSVEVEDPLVGGQEEVVSKLRAAGRKVYVNAGSISDIEAGIAAGADGVGLFRTEFLFIGRDSEPGAEEQESIYSQALLTCGGKPLTLRTLDVGGDKRIPYIEIPAEENPFLGLRGVRLTLARPELFRTQLKAVLAAARSVRASRPEWFADRSPLRLMIPMVCLPEEIRQVRAILEDIDPGYRDLVSLGIMIETPAAVFGAEALAAECDFFSIGTNDLTQYVMAADRGNPGVAYLYDSYNPAVQRAVSAAVRAAHSAGIPAGICGELASDPLATEMLVSSGLDSFSLSKL